MKNNYLVSVIIATYKRDKTLFRALQSLESQTYRNIEVIVVDDNEADQYHKVVFDTVSYFKDSLTINLIVNSHNLGSAHSRNIGISNAAGEYVTFLDDDDIYLPEKIEKQLECMVINDSDYSITDMQLVDEKGRLFERRERIYLIEEECPDLLTCHLKFHLTGTDTMMFRTSYLEKIGGFDSEDFGDEYYLMLKAILNDGIFSYLHRSDVIAEIHKNNEGISIGQSKIDGEIELFNYKKQYIQKLSNSDKRYVIMRHYAVLSFAYLRMNNYLLFLINGIKAVISSPFQSLSLLLELR